MVYCINDGCRMKTSNKDGLGIFRITPMINNQGEKYEKLTRERRKGWISAISRKDKSTKKVFETKRVRGKHFALSHCGFLHHSHCLSHKTHILTFYRCISFPITTSMSTLTVLFVVTKHIHLHMHLAIL